MSSCYRVSTNPLEISEVVKILQEPHENEFISSYAIIDTHLPSNVSNSGLDATHPLNHSDDGHVNDFDSQPTQPPSNISDSGSGQVDNFENGLTLSCKCRTRCTRKKSCPCKRLGNPCSKLCHPGQSCTNKIHPSSSQCICVDEYCSNSVQQWVSCKGLNLTVKDKMCHLKWSVAK